MIPLSETGLEQEMSGIHGVWGERERRKKERICVEWPVWVHGVDAQGRAFRAHTLLDNLSASGLHLQIPYCVEPATQLRMFIRFPAAGNGEGAAPRIEVSGIVRRAEERRAGLYGLGVEFTSFDF